MDAFRQSRADDWISAARGSLFEMRRQSDTVSVVGLSMGGALAVLLAAEASDIPALILIAPYLGMPKLLRLAAATHWLWGGLAGEINASDPRSVRDPIEREKNLAYGAVTGRTLFELSKVMNRARNALPRVTTPTLLVQSREDPRVASNVAEFAYDKLGTKDKKLVWTEGAGHIITVDYGRERVFGEVEKWLSAHDKRSATAASE
jgi:carboxylesterase